MPITQLSEWTQRLNAGAVDLSNLDRLQEWGFDEILSQIEKLYPMEFLRKQSRDKVEIGRSRYVRRYTRRKARLEDSLMASTNQTTHVFFPCVILTGESGVLTTLALTNELRVRPSSKSFEISTGSGFSLYRDPDGWQLKILNARTIRLSPETLQKHGWILQGVGMSSLDSEH